LEPGTVAALNADQRMRMQRDEDGYQQAAVVSSDKGKDAESG
jgi:hypothetical protein